MGGEQVKVYVELRLDDGEVKHEGLWAEPVGEALYKVWNLSAFVKGLNFMDVVRCEVQSDGLLVVDEVITESGHRTVWMTFHRHGSFEDRQGVLDELQGMGIRPLEKFSDDRWGLNVPPDADYQQVHTYLQARKAEGLLSIVEAAS